MGDKLYDVMVHPHQYASKKHAQKNTGVIKNSILRYPRSMTIDAIAEACVTGHVVAFCHAEDTGIKKSFTADCWRYQQIYALDLDNAGKDQKKFDCPYYMEYADALDHVEKQGFSPAFLYTTGSHTDDFHKYRMVFVLDRPVTSSLDHERVQKAFMSMLAIDGHTLLDSSCIEPSRVFYPGKELVYKDSSAVIQLDKLLEKYPHSSFKKLKQVVEDKPVKMKSEKKDYNDTIKQVAEEIKQKQYERKTATKSLRSRAIAGVTANTPLSRTKYNNIMFSSAYKEIAVNPCYITVPEEFDAFCYQIDFGELLGLPTEEDFCCILPEHDDNDPSARITWHGNRYRYRCFGCGETFDIFSMLEKISGCCRYAVMDWICERFNVRYETDWQRMRKEEILQYHDYMVQDLKVEYPVLYKRLTTRRESMVLNMFLDVARMQVLDRAWAGMNKPIFYYALKSFAIKGEYYGIRSDMETIHKTLIYLAHLGLIEILADEQIPPQMNKLLKRIQKQTASRNRVTCYSVPLLSHELLSHAQEVVIEDKRLSLRKGFLCREQLLRAEGKEHTDNIFVQSKDFESKEEVGIFYARYKAATEKLLEKQGWTTEEQILNRIKAQFKSKKKDGQETVKMLTKQQKTKLSGICLPQLLDELHLQRVPFTKEIESEYSVKPRKKLHYGSSKVIIRE